MQGVHRRMVLVALFPIFEINFVHFVVAIFDEIANCGFTSITHISEKISRCCFTKI